jgi:DNA polymerase III epsilon subunit-like protein
MKYTLMFLDTETTGNQEEDRLTQVAYKYPDVSCVEAYFKPPLKIKIEAMEVTHITNEMVADKEVFKNSATWHDLKKKFDEPTTILIAHNAPFDVAMLEKEGLYPPLVIDTLRVARALDTEAKLPAYRLQYLRYLLELDKDIDEPIQAHDAKGDVIVLEKFFDRLLQKIKNDTPEDEAALERMMQISKEPVLFRRLSFGKHKDQLIEDIAKTDRGYLEWLYKQKLQSEADETDWLYTLKKALGIPDQPTIQ